MSIARHHTEWLSLTEVSGPFLSLPVLIRAFPQGLEKVDPALVPQLSVAYDEWREDQTRPARAAATHHAWVEYILRTILEFPAETIASGQAIPESLKATLPEHGETLRPNLVIRNAEDGNARLLVSVYPADQALGKRVAGRRWSASPETRMTELLHATGVRLGLVTNGEQWMLVDAPRDDTAGFASWFAGLWLEERITLQSFRSLLGAPRFFGVAESETIQALLAESAQNQQEVTTQLGYQVRRAVEVLVDAFDRADQDRHRELLSGVPETEIYEASLTVMMRLVFLFCAEERELLLLGDPLFDQNYAVSPLREQLRQAADQHGEEVLERRHDAWSRLLATFRAVHGGVRHERMAIPPYGGALFDPDRFPFLEGRAHGTIWRETSADPLPVDNRTVLHLLEALQLLQVRVPGGGPAEARRLSFRALDIEQIGHVYEGLLDHTAKRATETTVSLAGTRSKNGDTEPEVSISKLEALAARGRAELVEWVSEETGRSEKTIGKLLDQGVSAEDEQRFRVVCGSGRDGEMLWQRVRPFAALVRGDSFGRPVVIQAGSVHVTEGNDRRSTGTQYTPRSLTEPIVQHTLEPLVYVGAVEGSSREKWRLRAPRELLELKICDFTCGSGAFLVQACRYLSERLREAWEEIERSSPEILRITPDGEPSGGLPEERLIPKNPDERVTYSMRLVAQRCLYGVDINPLAVEMAKLSMWLLTLSKDQPFTFLDHAIRCGDSLLGITGVEQLKRFSLADGPVQRTIAQTDTFDELVDDAIANRLRLERIEGVTVQDVEAQAKLLNAVQVRLASLKMAADQLVAAAIGDVQRDEAIRVSNLALSSGTRSEGRNSRLFFHWPFEFPEVLVKQGGFDAFVGNPPFMGGKKITGNMGSDYREFLLKNVADGKKGNADICAYFFLRMSSLLRENGMSGLLATNTIAQGDTREVGLEQLLVRGFSIPRAIASRKWPGQANLEVAHVWLRHGVWAGENVLDDKIVSKVTAFLTPLGKTEGKPHRLMANVGKSFQGSIVLGMGFVLEPTEARRLLEKDIRNREVIFPYLNGEDLNSRPDQSPSRWVINFFDWPLEKAETYPDAMRIVRERVKPERDKLATKKDPSAQGYARLWWQFGRKGIDLYASIARLKNALVIPETTKYCCFTRCPTTIVFSHMTKVIALDGSSPFALLGSTIHEQWAREYSSTLETRLKYITTDAFETFPFPLDISSLDDIGGRYEDHRRSILLGRQEGLTKTYNRFHDSRETSEDIQKLRDLRVEMDHAVTKVYGWNDLDLDHDFHDAKQGLRFTVSETARCEILDRLLQLNHERYAEEMKQGSGERGSGAKKAGRQKKADVLIADADPAKLFD